MKSLVIILIFVLPSVSLGSGPYFFNGGWYKYRTPYVNRYGQRRVKYSGITSAPSRSSNLNININDDENKFWDSIGRYLREDSDKYWKSQDQINKAHDKQMMYHARAMLLEKLNIRARPGNMYYGANALMSPQLTSAGYQYPSSAAPVAMRSDAYAGNTIIGHRKTTVKDVWNKDRSAVLGSQLASSREDAAALQGQVNEGFIEALRMELSANKEIAKEVAKIEQAVVDGENAEKVIGMIELVVRSALEAARSTRETETTTEETTMDIPSGENDGGNSGVTLTPVAPGNLQVSLDVLKNNCTSCHSANNGSGGLAFDGSMKITKEHADKAYWAVMWRLGFTDKDKLSSLGISVKKPMPPESNNPVNYSMTNKLREELLSITE